MSFRSRAFAYLLFSHAGLFISITSWAAGPEISKALAALSQAQGESALKIVQTIRTREIGTTKYQHYYRGLEVVGSMAMVHKTARGADLTKSLAVFDLDTRASLSARDAALLAKAVAGDHLLGEEPALKILPGEDDLSARLVYWAKAPAKDAFGGREVVIDAHSGELIAEFPVRKTLAPIDVYETNSRCQRMSPWGDGSAEVVPAECDQVVKAGRDLGADASARNALRNATTVLAYFASKHGRNSYDGQGSPSVSVVHVGERYVNAYWDPQNRYMAYGDGDGVEYGDFTRALDVAGHELTHGVTSTTAKFTGFAESGALDEAYADFFGIAVTGNREWALGRALAMDPSKSEGFRNLKDPNRIIVEYADARGNIVKKPYPKHMREMFPGKTGCNGANDYCWVHVNATVFGHAGYLVTQAIGADKAQKLFYTTLTQFLTSTSTFKKARAATASACKKLLDSRTCTQVTQAFAKVGL